MDPIKEAFQKIKEDMNKLKEEIESIRKTLLVQQTNKNSLNFPQQTDRPTPNTKNQTENLPQQTSNTSPTQNPTDNLPLKPLKTPNSTISIGNEGVPTDRQTDQQTDNSTGNRGVKFAQSSKQSQSSSLTKLQNITEFLNSLDVIKKELRTKIKKLTNQEMLVFSTIYQLEEEGFIVDYSLLAQKLTLTESSIRDYTQRIIKKGLPLEKYKENNKKILLSISSDLKKIASLTTIFQLREI